VRATQRFRACLRRNPADEVFSVAKAYSRWPYLIDLLFCGFKSLAEIDLDFQATLISAGWAALKEGGYRLCVSQLIRSTSQIPVVAKSHEESSPEATQSRALRRLEYPPQECRQPIAKPRTSIGQGMDNTLHEVAWLSEVSKGKSWS